MGDNQEIEMETEMERKDDGPVTAPSDPLPSSPSRESELLHSSVHFPLADAVGEAPSSAISGELKQRKRDEIRDGIEEEDTVKDNFRTSSAPSSASSNPRPSLLQRAASRSAAAALIAANDKHHFPHTLPPAFTGASGLLMPPYLSKGFASVTLPSRLELLGRRHWKIMAAFNSKSVGNCILGFAHTWTQGKLSKELFILPWTFSKSAAKLALFVRLFFLLIFGLLILSTTGAVALNVGRVWPIGALCALYVIYRLCQYKRVPDGIIPFLSLIGQSDMEVYMFSYSWKVEAENIRTLAKAMHLANCATWCDVIKLVPGEAIRARLRTTLARVFRVVIFLSPEYVASPNCCVEALEAVQRPANVIVCVLKPVDPSIMEFFHSLPGLTVVHGFDELIPLLDHEVSDPHNSRFFEWWKHQRIAGSGVPENVVPTKEWTGIPRFSLLARPWLPDKSLSIGGLYLSGDCLDSGYRLALPPLLLIAVAGVAINTVDIILKYQDDSGRHEEIDYVWLGLIALCNLAPFFSFRNLLETRRDLSAPLKPLLASKSMGLGGVRVRVDGAADDPIVKNLRNFLSLIGHAPSDGGDGEGGEDGQPMNGHSRPSHTGRERIITVYVMDSIASRDRLFGSDVFPFDERFSLFVWSGPKDPFTQDEIGKRVMRFLVLIAGWDRRLLASNLFSAIGIRVVDALHADDKRGTEETRD